MTLRELLEAVKDESLPLQMVEKYRDELVHLHSLFQLELADIEKRGAFYFDSNTAPDVTDISIKRKWQATIDGQRQIELNRSIKTIVKEIDSLKKRRRKTIRL